ncbi:MAG: hypothetical protein QG656_102 [Candidatus Hydrogenedentes bacterium]|nr:hypothetical protein [Candidatus Hydrogenedentota bacterium]
MKCTTRRTFIRHAAGGALGMAATARCAFGEDSPVTDSPKRPNLLFVFGDQLRYDACGYAGNALAHTPHIDALAHAGVSFRNAVSSTPVCAAFRASLMTGKYTTSTGMVINELRLSPDHECFGHVLSGAGYRTGYIGKWHLWANQLGHHDDPQNGFVPPGPYRLGFDGYWAAHNFNHQYYGGYYFEDTPERIAIDGYEPDAQTGLAIRFLEREAHSDAPFALFVSFGTPHDPWGEDNVPKEWMDRFRDVPFPNPPNYRPENDPRSDNWGMLSPEQRPLLEQWRRVYHAQAASMDWNIGRLLDALDKTGQAENTVVVFTSDHGEMFGAQGRRAKNVFYEEACRIPFVVRYPRSVPRGSSSDACLTTPDMMPTVLGLMGLPVPKAAEGMDLSHCAQGKPGPEPEAALLQNTGACAAWTEEHEWRAVRDKRYTFTVYRVDGCELLFDNIADPYQTANLARMPEHAETADRLRAYLKTRMAELNDTFEKSTYYRDRWTRDRVILKGAKGGSHDLERMNDILRKYWGEQARTTPI